MGSWQITRSYSRPSEAKVAAGNRFARASIKLRAACWVSSAEDVFGMAQLCGKIDSFGDVFSGCGRGVDAVEVIVFGIVANVPAANAVTGQGVADGRGFTEEHVHARWSDRRVNEVVGALRWDSAERRRLMQDGQSRMSVVVTWKMRRHQKWS